MNPPIVVIGGGWHPLPIYRVDENGAGVECGRADVLVVKDRMIMAMMAGSVVEVFEGLGDGCCNY